MEFRSRVDSAGDRPSGEDAASFLFFSLSYSYDDWFLYGFKQDFHKNQNLVRMKLDKMCCPECIKFATVIFTFLDENESVFCEKKNA